MSFKLRLTEASLTTLVILILFSLVIDGLSSVLYAIAAIGCHYLLTRIQVPQHDQLAHDRIKWLISIILPINQQLRYDPRTYYELASGQSQDSAIKQGELGLQSFRMDQVSILPDLVAAENEMARLEERASIILGSIVFIPVIFALIHLFRSVGLGIFLLELYCAMILGIVAILSQNQKYKLEGWQRVYQFLQTNKFELIQNPRRLMNSSEQFQEIYVRQELGIEIDHESEVFAEQFLHQIVTFLIRLQPHDRDQFIALVLEAVKELPNKEVVLSEKWQTYRTRVILINFSATALSGLFVSLSRFNLPLLSTPEFQFMSTPYLIWGQFILVIGLTLLLLSRWFEPRQTAIYLVLFAVIYFGFYQINSLLV